MDDPWNERRHPHIIIYLFVIVLCAAPLIVAFISALMGVSW